MAEGEVRQYWVRNDRGTMWGPLTAPTIELLIDSGAIQGRIQVSNDGLQFAFPWRFPEVRDAFPRELWGDGAPASLLQSAPGAPPPPGPSAPVAAPTAGPGAVNAPRPAGPPPTAGPGAMRAPAPAVRAGVDASGRPIATQAAGPGAPPRPGAPVVGPPPAQARPAAPVPQAPQAVLDDGTNAVPPQGQLQQYSPVQLYGRIAAGEHTGLLTLGLSDRTLWVHFRKGNPEFVDSSHAEDSLGLSLLGARLLTAEQLQQAEGSLERFGGDLLAALFGLGILQPATAFTQLAQRGGAILARVLRAESGTFTFEVRDLPSQKAMPLGNRWAVLSDQVRRIPTSDLKRRLAQVLALPIMKSGGRVPASELRLTPHEVRALAFIDGVRSLGQLLQDVPQDADHLLRLAFLLKELNGVSFASASRTQTGPTAAAGATAAAPPPAAARPAAPGAPTAGPGMAAAGSGVAAAGSGVAAAGPGAPAAGPGVAAGVPAAGPGVAAAGPGAAPRPSGAPAGAAPTAGPGAAPRPPGAPAGAAPTAGPGAAPRPPGAAAGAAPTAGAGAAPRSPGAPAGAAPTAGPGAAPRPPGASAGAAPTAGPGAAPRPPGAPAGAAPTAGPGAAPRPPGANPTGAAPTAGPGT
ncbi:DUF4388 domain-containing protein, partial [Corallococcus llansteffanensis]